MKNILLLILVFSSSLLFCQTQKESEEWINTKLSYYQRIYPNSGIETKSSTYIEDGYLYNYNFFSTENGKYGSESWSAIKINDVTKITYSNSKSVAGDKWFSIGLWFEKGKMVEKEIKKMDNSTPDTEYKANYHRTAIILNLDNSFLEDGMKPRLEKALQHIIKLNGGKVEVIEKKEAF